MKKMSKPSKIIASALTIAAMAAMTIVPTFAANTPVNGGALDIDKYLVMSTDATVPPVNAAFEIVSGAAKAATATTNAIKAGPAGAKLTFDTDNTDGEVVVPFSSADTTETAATDDFTPEDGQKYVKKTFKADFSGVSFTEPGVYRYIITEKEPSNTAVAKDADNVRYIDVFVNSDAAGKLSVAGTVMHTDEAEVPNIDSAAEYDATGKKECFINNYETHNLVIKKTVDGNMANRDEYFPITVDISKAVAGTKYEVDLTNATSSAIKASYNDGTSVDATNPAELTVAEDGTVSQTFYIKHGEYITIKGLTPTTEYVVKEADNAEYKESFVQNAGEKTDGLATAALAIGSDDDNVEFINYRNGTIPTGVILAVLPYIAALLLAITGFAVFAIIKKRKANND